MQRTRARLARWLSARRHLAGAVVVAILLAGCSEPEEVQSEPKRADDKITAAELESFLSMIDSLPEKALPQIPSVMAAAPQWTRNRTLPVFEYSRERGRFVQR